MLVSPMHSNKDTVKLTINVRPGVAGCSKSNNCLEADDVNICMKSQTTEPEAPYVAQLRNEPHTSSRHIHPEIELLATWILDVQTPPLLGIFTALTNVFDEVYNIIGCEHSAKDVSAMGGLCTTLLSIKSAVTNLSIDEVVRIGIDCDSNGACGDICVGWETSHISCTYPLDGVCMMKHSSHYHVSSNLPTKSTR